MKVQNIIGVDISKKTIDLLAKPVKSHVVIDNAQKGYRELLNWLKKQKINKSDCLLVMEHTGLYSYPFEQFLHANQISFTKVSSLAIKRSMGLVRGKSDKIDAERIATYGFEKRESLSPDPGLDINLTKLKMLQSTRRRLVNHRKALCCAVKEYQHIGIPENDLIISSQKKVIKEFTKQIEAVENAIKDIIKSQDEINKHFQLLTSQIGIGDVVATSVIIKTNNFQQFSNPRKFACYSGIAPFEHRSGTSIKGKTRVSHLADKEMKTLLDMASRAAIQHDPELKAYYLRRIEDGKSKMSTLNIIRNKMLYRMFAIIKRQTPYVKDYLKRA